MQVEHTSNRISGLSQRFTPGSTVFGLVGCGHQSIRCTVAGCEDNGCSELLQEHLGRSTVESSILPDSNRGWSGCGTAV